MTEHLPYGLVWTEHARRGGTWFRDYYRSPWPFQETVARIYAASGQHIEAGDKVTFDFTGTFNGQTFTLYDYYEDAEIHIGGDDHLNVSGLVAALTDALQAVEPKSYRANYHSWSAV